MANNELWFIGKTVHLLNYDQSAGDLARGEEPGGGEAMVCEEEADPQTRLPLRLVVEIQGVAGPMKVEVDFARVATRVGRRWMTIAEQVELRRSGRQ